MLSVLSVTLPFFALIGLGWLSRRLSILPDTAVSALTAFVFNFALPALLFRSAATRNIADIIDPLFVVLYMAVVVGLFAVTMVQARLLFRQSLQGQAVHGFSATVTNLGFMGLPLIAGLLGEGAVPPMVLMLTLDVAVTQTVTMAFLEYGASNASGHMARTRVFAAAKGTFRNPLIVAILAGIVFSLLQIPLPDMAINFLSLLGDAAGPVALFALGASLFGRPITDSLGEATLLAFVKLAIHPLAMAAVMFGIGGVDPLWAKTAVLVAALPSASNIYIIAARYGSRPALASTTVLISTAAAVVTVSVLAWLW